MRRLHNKKLWNRKGTSLVEIIVALTILGIISVVATLFFTGSMQTSNKSKEQLDLNTVIDTVRENVTNAVKQPDSAILGNGGAILVSTSGSLAAGFSDLVVKDGSGDLKQGYKFDISQAAGEPTVITGPSILKYIVTLKKTDGSLVRKIRLEINTLSFNNTVI